MIGLGSTCWSNVNAICWGPAETTEMPWRSGPVVRPRVPFWLLVPASAIESARLPKLPVVRTAHSPTCANVFCPSSESLKVASTQLPLAVALIDFCSESAR